MIELKRLAVIALIAVAGASSTNFAHAAAYQITDFGTAVIPRALNDHGQVVGSLRRAPDSSSTDHPFYWSPDAPNSTTGTLTELPILASSNNGGDANDINDAGQIVGSSNSSMTSSAVLWSPTPVGPNTHEIHDLGNPVESGTGYIAAAINNSGQVVGNKLTGILLGGALGPSSSFIWTPQITNGSVGSLRNVPSGPSPYTGNAVYDINDSGQTSGRIFEFGISFGSRSRADVWSTASSSSSVPPTNLGFPPGDWSNAFGLSINNRGQVVGYAEDTNGQDHGFLWTPNVPNGITGVMRTLDGMTVAVDINDAGQVVGYGGVQEHAILWSDSQGAVDLNSVVAPSLGRTLTRAFAINNKGQILALTTTPNPEGFMLSPVAGDYNHDGIVDATDYTVWRDTLDSTTDLAADGNANGTVDPGDYDVWKSNFGNHLGLGAGANAAIPEPATLWMLVAGILTMCGRRLSNVP